ncbi:Uncharacterized protein YhiN [hydrothermal vent metagenome]|uniref:Uncharacterized protein YhiN n=1 Tax=hydrothermal vent metagenome TaxID=652676 RepID=A0A3B1DMQ2_9ZZZZ
MRKIDVIIIGAGASGLMCAIEAGKRGRSVVVLEHNMEVGKKIRISGGGRCNFTNIHTEFQNYLSSNPHFFKSALSCFTPHDFCQMVEQYSVPYHEKKLGQLFCDDSAQSIIDLLLNECDKYNVEIFCDSKINNVINSASFTIKTNHEEFQCESLVIASGGLSIPSLGASNFGYRIANQFGLNIIETRPGLVPMMWDAKNKMLFEDLAGVSVDVEVRHKKTYFRENILFTHKGLSGPAILQISSYCESGDTISINLLPNHNFNEIFEKNKRNRVYLKHILFKYLPRRLVHALIDNKLIANKFFVSYNQKEIQKLSKFLHGWEVPFQLTEGYDKAEVTVGGVDTNELSSKTMESRKVEGLYFIGEVVDVTGHLGGFNFQWAWASGFAAGQSV